MSEEKTEKKSLKELEADLERILTDDVLALIDHPIEIQDDDGNWLPVGMRMFPPQVISEYNARYNTLKPVWSTLIEVLEKKKSGKNNGKNIPEEIRARILESAEETDAAEVSAIMLEVYRLLDAAASSDARTIMVNDSLTHLSGVFSDAASESVSSFGIPADLREQSTESLLATFNNVHYALKDLQKNVNGLFESFWQNWSQYKPHFAETEYRLNDKNLPMHPEDGRALRSKFAGDSEDGGTFSRVYGHRALNYSVGFKFGNGKETTKNLATDYRDPTFALPNFCRELNRAMAEKDQRSSLGFVTTAQLIHLIRATDETLEKKSDTDVLGKKEWTVTIPGTNVTVRRVPEKSAE